MADPNAPSFLTPQQLALMGEPFGQEEDLLKQQLAQAEALRKRGPQHTTGLGAALGGIGDIINTATANSREAGIQKQRQAMFQRQRANAQAVYGMTQQPATANPSSPTDMLGEPTPEDERRAQVAALRRQSQAAIAASVSDNPMLQRFGPMALSDAREQQQMMAGEQQHALQLAMERDRLAEEKNYHKGELANAKERNEMDNWTGIPGTGILLNRKTGQTMQAPLGPAGTSGKPLSQKDVDAEFEKFRQAVSTYSGRANLNRDNQATMQRSDALEALLHVPDMSKITPQQLREASTSLAGLISRGGPQAVSQIEEFTPQTLASKFANAKQYLLNEPAGANAQAFLQNMLDTAAREKKVLSEQIRRGQLQAIPNYAHLRKIDQKRFESILRAPGIGIDPATIDENGLETRAQAGNPSGSSSAQTTSSGSAGLSPPHGQTVIQNGHTFSWNPSTGQYE